MSEKTHQQIAAELASLRGSPSISSGVEARVFHLESQVHNIINVHLRQQTTLIDDYHAVVVAMEKLVDRREFTPVQIIAYGWMITLFAICFLVTIYFLFIK